MFAKSVGRLYHFTLERLPNYGSVLNDEVCLSSVGSDFAGGDVEDVHDTNNVVLSIAAALHVVV